MSNPIWPLASCLALGILIPSQALPAESTVLKKITPSEGGCAQACSVAHPACCPTFQVRPGGPPINIQDEKGNTIFTYKPRAE